MFFWHVDSVWHFPPPLRVHLQKNQLLQKKLTEEFCSFFKEMTYLHILLYKVFWAQSLAIKMYLPQSKKANECNHWLDHIQIDIVVVKFYSLFTLDMVVLGISHAMINFWE